MNNPASTSSAHAQSHAHSHSVYGQSAVERVYIGRPAADAVGAEVAATGARRVFIMASGTLARQTDEIARIRTALGTRYAGLFADIPAHGSRASVLEAAAQARAASADALLAVGGGSVIDATKMVSLCLRHDIREHDAFEPFRITLNSGGRGVAPAFEGPDVRIIAVPTTLSGAEFYEAAGVTNERLGRKQGFSHRLMVPRAIVLDAEITRHTPRPLWLSSGVRAVDHAVETLGSLLSNAYCDAMGESALRTLAQALPRTGDRQADARHSLDCLVAVWQAMQPLAGGVPMGISHATGHALGGAFGVPHGHTSCVTAPGALAFNASANGHRQQRISAALGDATAPASVLLDRFIRSLGMPRSLGEVGLTGDDMPKLLDAVMHDRWTWTNPRPLDRDAVKAFLDTLA